MAHQILTSIEMEATPAQVWAVLTAFEQYAGWNPFMVRAQAVRVHHHEQFSGRLLPLLWSRFEREVRPGFEAMNAALKARVEQGEPDQVEKT